MINLTHQALMSLEAGKTGLEDVAGVGDVVLVELKGHC